MFSHDRRGGRMFENQASRRCRSRSHRSGRRRSSRHGRRKSSRSRSNHRESPEDRPQSDRGDELMLLVTEETARCIAGERGRLRQRHDVTITFGDIFGETEQVLLMMSNAGSGSLHDAAKVVLKEIAAAQKNTTIIDVRVVANRWIIDAMNLCRVLNEAQYACAEVAERDGHFQAVSVKGTIQECSRLLDVATGELRRRYCKSNRQFIPSQKGHANPNVCLQARPPNGHGGGAASSNSRHENSRHRPWGSWNSERGENRERSETRVGFRERSSSFIRGRNVSSRSTTAPSVHRRSPTCSREKNWQQRRHQSRSKGRQRDISEWHADRSRSGRMTPPQNRSRSASPCSQGSWQKDKKRAASPVAPLNERAGVWKDIESRDSISPRGDGMSPRERSPSVPLQRIQAKSSPKAPTAVTTELTAETREEEENERRGEIEKEDVSQENEEFSHLAEEAASAEASNPAGRESEAEDAPPAGDAPAEGDFDPGELSPTLAVTSDPYMDLDPADE
mmetsp:Transcript_154641/g.267837  ORF Transcript_154641/g.267837 Transcript_154641/m.267837 type:complete len:507 (-) Transcript_154641:18-1538(-)